MNLNKKKHIKKMMLINEEFSEWIKFNVSPLIWNYYLTEEDEYFYVEEKTKDTTFYNVTPMTLSSIKTNYYLENGGIEEKFFQNSQAAEMKNKEFEKWFELQIDNNKYFNYIELMDYFKNIFEAQRNKNLNKTIEKIIDNLHLLNLKALNKKMLKIQDEQEQNNKKTNQ